MIQTLSSPRLTLRPLTQADAEALLGLREWFGASDVDALRERLRHWESRRSPLAWLHADHPVVEANIADANVASQRVARRCGFDRTGRTGGGEAVWQHTA